MDKERKWRKKGKQIGEKEERKTVRERKKRGGKKKGDFPCVPTVGTRWSEKKS